MQMLVIFQDQMVTTSVVAEYEIDAITVLKVWKESPKILTIECSEITAPDDIIGSSDR